MIQLDTKRLQWLSKVRRDLHSHPELSFQETRTTSYVMDILQALGIKAFRLPKSPGAVAVVEGEGPGPCLGLRADMDALPVNEENQVDYRSKNPGVMHACGHDANTAIMLGVARQLSQRANSFNGTVKFIFQPAEEKEFGAKKVIAQGVLEDPRVDRILAGHMTPELDVGQVGIFRTKGYAAADLFQVHIEGEGGHGGRPHQTRDPLVAGAYLVTAVQSIVSRSLNPVDSGVISVGRFQAGTTGNVIPKSATLEGTIRSHSDATRELIFTRLKELVQGTERAFGVSCELKIIPETPGCNNDEEVSAFLYDIATDLVGEDQVFWLAPTMGAEDFAYFTRERPGAIVRFGCRNKERGIDFPLHSPNFDIDEKALDIGVELFWRALKAYLSKENEVKVIKRTGLL